MNAVMLSRSPHFVFGLLALLLAFVALQPSRPAQWPEVSIPEAIALVDSGALVIDVRDRSVSASTHLPGAMLVPLETLSANMPKIQAAAENRPVVVYCGNGTTRGPEAARKLNEAGVAARNLKPGMEGWKAAGMPVGRS